MKHSRIIIAGIFVLALLAGVGLAARADGITIRYVAPSGSDDSDCTNPTFPCATIQFALDQARDGDEVHVAAGTLTDINDLGGLAQVVYVAKTVTIRGGYADSTSPAWAAARPATTPATTPAAASTSSPPPPPRTAPAAGCI
jgi:hypothetical protein